MTWCQFRDPIQTWPERLLKQAKGSAGLRCLDWNGGDSFPVEIVLEALKEGCWPELCEFRLRERCCSDQELADIFRVLTSGRLTHLLLSHGSLGLRTFGCLRDLYFGHLRELDFARSIVVLSEMVQEILTGCVHLVKLDVPHVFVRDIATASNPWGCLGLEELVVFIAKRPEDEDGWEGRVFEQISRLRQLRTLDLQRDPHDFMFSGTP
ncbi:hypothetical protein BGX23_001093 [Mortierella sp. AD031]|nr:hypothetical protein BGX23_001093 [Mortierella sp. AD031]